MNSLLSGIVKDKNWHHRLGLYKVFDFWEEVVGVNIAAQARPYVIRENVLWINVTDNVWMQQLHLQKNGMLELINQRLAQEKLIDLRFRLESDFSRQEKLPTMERAPVVQPSHPVDKKKLGEFENMISCIDNVETRESMIRLWIKLQQVRGPES